MDPLETSILCRTAISIPATATGEMMYMPGGVQTITPWAGALDGQPQISVQVDAQSARMLESQRSALAAKGKRPYFDFNHEDGEASFWPQEFFWREQPEPGVYCRGEWTSDGKAKVEGKAWRQFSPVFHVDNKRGNPARIVCRESAKPNMGGLVNDPAFHTILPLWAKNAAGAHPDKTNQPSTDNMNEKELAALQAKILEQQREIDALKAKESDTKQRQENADLVTAEIKAKEHEKRVTEQTLEIEALKAKAKSQADSIAARNKADAEGAVKKAVERGAIAAKDTKAQEALVARATDDPNFLYVIHAMQGQNLSGRMTPAGVNITQEAPNAIMKAYAAIVCRNTKIPLTLETHREKGRLAREAAALFAKDIESDKVISSMSMDDAIKAADNNDASVGLLSGTLVLQRALPLLMYEYPLLSSVSTDFSDAPGLYNQTETTRIVTTPAVQSYDTTVDSAGRPKGWDTVSRAQTVDVSIKLDEHIGIPIVFGQNTLSQTVRSLFAETAPKALYALGGYAVNKLTALMTAANFNAYAQITDASCGTTSGSTAITLASTAGVYPGQSISGTGIPANTYIASVPSSGNAVLTQAATATATVTATLGGGKVPTVMATYVKQLADFNMASLGDIATAFDVNEVPMQERFVLLNSQYYHRLAQDPTFNTFFAAMQKPDVITKGTLPELQGFQPQNAPWFPTSSNRVGWAGTKAALALKSRLPSDFTSAVGAQAPGTVTTVTVPGGISVLLVQRIDLTGNFAEWRPEVYLGAAVGDRRGGLVLTSQ